MFDPLAMILFPVALVCGPLAWLMLLHGEAQRADRSLWPRRTSVALGLLAVWGLSYWALLIAVELFGEAMTPAAFGQWHRFSPIAPALLVTASYCLLVRRRGRVAAAPQ